MVRDEQVMVTYLRPGKSRTLAPFPLLLGIASPPVPKGPE